MNKAIQLAWAAGFYDGEGSSKRINYHYKDKKGRPRSPSKNVCMSVSQAELRPLLKFKKAVNDLGHINGPYQYGTNKRPYWIWSASCSAAREVFRLLRPYLHTTKKKQFLLVSKEINRNSSRKKGWVNNV